MRTKTNQQQPKKIPLPRPSHTVPFSSTSSSTSSSPSFFSTMTQGAALGMGSSAGQGAVSLLTTNFNGDQRSPEKFGHRIVDGLFEPQENKKICLDKAPYKNKEPTITFDDPYLCNKKMEQYVKCTHEQSNHSICDKLYDNYLQCVSSHLERE